MAVDKLIDSAQLDADLTSVASAIRSKGGTSGSLVFPSGFVSAVNDLPQMTSPLSFLGADVELLNDNLYSKEFVLADTGYNGWTPSTTAKAIIASETHNNAFTATDMDNYEYYLIWECGIDPVYTGTPTQKALTLMSRAWLAQEIFRRPSSWANIQSGVANGNVCNSAFTSCFLRYYGTTTGSVTYTWSTSYGFYYTLTAATFSSTTADSPNVNLKTPVVNTRCSTTYFSTTNAGLIDQENSTGFMRCKLYRVKQPGILRGIYNQVTNLINEG